MPMMQAAREALRQDIRQAVDEAVQAAQSAAQTAQAAKAGGTPQAPTAPPVLEPLAPIPVGGGRLIIDKRGDQTVITSASMPPEFLPAAQMAQETALGLVGLIAAMVILGPFARVLARRFDRRTELQAAGGNAQVLQQQLVQLQQSVDAMSIEMERISEAQRFQSRLLNEGRPGTPRG